MSFTENGNGMYMPVAPAYGGGYGGGLFGGDGAWWIIILLLCGFGGWGGMGMGGMWPMMMGGMGGWGMDYLYPWLNNSQNINGGFRDQMLQTSIAGIGDKITTGFGDISTQLCGGFAGVNAGIANAAAQAEISANARQMANMQQLFGVQTGIGDLKYTVAQENCLDRQAVSDGIRDVLANQTAGVQRILDKLCDQELQAERRENANLRSELQYARGQASQTEQTARILAGQTAEVDALYNRLSNCPVPSTPVYGRIPIFTCGQNGGCGCSGNNFFN